MKVKRKIIQIDEERCDGCGQCVPSCAEGALEIIDGKARIIADKLCDGLGACLGECPNDALQVIERAADEFDEDAVEAHLATHTPSPVPAPAKAPTGCPSAGLQMFDRRPARPVAPEQGGDSELSHWPVQIHLVPANAPFLKGAELLVVADCVPVAYRSFHQDFLRGKVVMMGCPKFDDVQAYIDKFEQIARRSGVISITTVIMDVPCCSGLPAVVRRGVAASGHKIPMEEVVVSRRGQILERSRVA